MKKLTFDDVLARANKKYKNLKALKHPYMAPELLTDMNSDSIKAVVETFVDILNEINSKASKKKKK